MESLGTEGLRSIHNYLVPQGTLIRGVRNNGTTTTAPAHSILMSGHKSRLANFANDTGAGSYRPTRPTWIEALRAQYGEEAMVMANQSLIEPMSWSIHPEGGPDLGASFIFVPEEPGSNQPAGNDAPVFAQLQRTLASEHPRWVMVNLKAVDRTGHYAVNPEGYLNAIRSVDQPIVQLWESLQTDPFYANNTVLIITSDHGRDREGQGDGTTEYWRNHGNANAGNRGDPPDHAGSRRTGRPGAGGRLRLAGHRAHDRSPDRGGDALGHRPAHRRGSGDLGRNTARGRGRRERQPERPAPSLVARARATLSDPSRRDRALRSQRPGRRGPHHRGPGTAHLGLLERATG